MIMNPKNLKIFSLPIYCNRDSEGQAFKSEKENGGFFSIIQKLSNPVQKESSLNKGDFYLEYLRKALLGKGRSLNKISLQSNDLPLLKKFLCQCGFSQENVDNLFNELLQNNPRGEINLSQFFNKISELDLYKEEIQQSITLEPSAIAYIESALRNLGLTQKQVEYVVSSASVKGGGLDLNKCIRNIKGISNKEIPSNTKVKLDQFVSDIQEAVCQSAKCEGWTPENELKPVNNKVYQGSKKLGEMEIQIHAEKKSEEQIAIKVAKQSQLPTDVKATVDQIVEKVGIADEKGRAQSTLFSFSKPELSDLHSKEKLGKKGKRVEKESLLSPSKEKGSISTKNGQQKVESSFSSHEAKLFSDTNAGKARPPRNSMAPAELNDGKRVFSSETIEGRSVVKSKTEIMDILQNISTSTSSESVNTAKNNEEPVRYFLPSYLIDQVGRQISRSILRGERVIKFQLKPPELGALKVEMDIKDNILTLGMITENNSVKELLLSNVNELKDALVQQGVKLDRLDVQINQNFNQSLAHSNEEQSQDHNWVPLITETDTEDPIPTSEPWNMIGGDRLLDLVA